MNEKVATLSLDQIISAWNASRPAPQTNLGTEQKDVTVGQHVVPATEFESNLVRNKKADFDAGFLK